jgi:hypothetical protein
MGAVGCRIDGGQEAKRETLDKIVSPIARSFCLTVAVLLAGGPLSVIRKVGVQLHLTVSRAVRRSAASPVEAGSSTNQKLIFLEAIHGRARAVGFLLARLPVPV